MVGISKERCPEALRNSPSLPIIWLATHVLDRSLLKGIIGKIRVNFAADGRPSRRAYQKAVEIYLKAGFLNEPIAFEKAVDSSIAGMSP